MFSQLSFEELQSMYGMIDPKLKSHKYALDISKKLSSLANTATGKKAIDFERTTDKGEKFNLKDLRGKHVLIDFWGSWCGPCRASHPHLLALYDKSKGFEIVGVAYEQVKDFAQETNIWKNAIEVDKLSYINVLNNEDVEKMDIVSSYGISAFPTKVLLDKNGVVIGRWVGEDPKMEDKLKEIFGL